MDLTGTLNGITRDYREKKPIVSFKVNENIDGIEDYDGKELKIRITKVTKPRSLDANAYFHVLCDKLRMKLNMSMAHMKNELITSYGQIDFLDDGEPIIYKTNAPPERVQELEEAHMKFLKQGADGAYWYRVYRGSHTYNSQEMHILLEGTIAEAQAQGIETKTPDELAKLEYMTRRIEHDTE